MGASPWNRPMATSMGGVRVTKVGRALRMKPIAVLMAAIRF